MKKLMMLMFVLIYAAAGYAQEADRITGVWWNEEKTSKIKIEEKNGKYVGSVVHIIPENYKNGKPPKDEKNPDESLRDRSVLGLQILKGFQYDAGDKEWVNGSIYDPKSGNTYDAYAWFEDKNVLKLKGYVAGVRWLGRTTEWYRAN